MTHARDAKVTKIVTIGQHSERQGVRKLNLVRLFLLLKYLKVVFSWPSVDRFGQKILGLMNFLVDQISDMQCIFLYILNS